MKIINKLLVIFLLPLYLPLAAQAQDGEFASARHAVGFGGGASGPGLIYRAYLPRSFIQGAFFARANRSDKLADLMLGATYGRILSELPVSKALPPTALVFVTELDARYSKGQFTDSIAAEVIDTQKSAHAGVGIALEFGNTFSPGMLVSFGITYALSVDERDSTLEWNLGPVVNVGLLFNW